MGKSCFRKKSKHKIKKKTAGNSLFFLKKIQKLNFFSFFRQIFFFYLFLVQILIFEKKLNLIHKKYYL